MNMKRVKFSTEFLFKASPAIIYKFLTSPDCLIRWFCDTIDITQKEFTFEWEGSVEKAKLIEDVEDTFLRFKWENADSDEEFLDFNISTSPITGETILQITDFADDDEIEDQIELWASQMDELRIETGGG